MIPAFVLCDGIQKKWNTKNRSRVFVFLRGQSFDYSSLAFQLLNSEDHACQFGLMRMPVPR